MGNYALTFVSPRPARKLKRSGAAAQGESGKEPPRRSSTAGPRKCCSLLETPDRRGSAAAERADQGAHSRPVFRPDAEVISATPSPARNTTRSRSTGDEARSSKSWCPTRAWSTETIIVTATPGQLMINTILPYPLKHSDEFLNVRAEQEGAVRDDPRLPPPCRHGRDDQAARRHEGHGLQVGDPLRPVASRSPTWTRRHDARR